MSPFTGSHRALDGVGPFVDPNDYKTLRAVSKSFRDARLVVAAIRAFEQRWVPRLASKRARLRADAVEVMGRFRGHEAVEDLLDVLRNDTRQYVAAAAATWLGRIARRASPADKKRLFDVASACYRDGRMNVQKAIERSFADVHDSPEDLFRHHPEQYSPTGYVKQQCPLVRFVTRTRAAREEEARRTVTREDARDLIARAAPIGTRCRFCECGSLSVRLAMCEREYIRAATTARDYIHRGGTVGGLRNDLLRGRVDVVDWPAPWGGPWARALATLGERLVLRDWEIRFGERYEVHPIVNKSE